MSSYFLRQLSDCLALLLGFSCYKVPGWRRLGLTGFPGGQGTGSDWPGWQEDSGGSILRQTQKRMARGSYCQNEIYTYAAVPPGDPHWTTLTDIARSYSMNERRKEQQQPISLGFRGRTDGVERGWDRVSVALCCQVGLMNSEFSNSEFSFVST